MKRRIRKKEPKTITEIINMAAFAAARLAVSELSATAPRRQYLRLPEAARLLGMKSHQLSNLVSSRYFGVREGVRRVSNKRIFIFWPRFEQTVLSGKWKAPFTRRPRRAEQNAG